MYSANQNWGLGTKFMISSEGYRQRVTVGNQQSELTVRPTYLRIPIEATYFFGKFGDKVRPKIYAGPSFGVRLSETHHTSGDYPLSELVAVKGDQFSDFDAGLTAGLGANIRVGRLTWLNLDGGYYHGLSDVHVDNDFNGNRNLRFNVGLLWGL
jgi:hypothetical protein